VIVKIDKQLEDCGVEMSWNKPKSMSKGPFFCNSCYTCLCGATLVTC
jgi:hypothetical protein